MLKKNCFFDAVQLIILCVIFLLPSLASAQLLPLKNFGSLNYGDFAHQDFNTKDLNQYPYLDIGVVIQGTEKLSNPTFMQRFRVTHFFTELKAMYNGQSFTVPILLMQKERRDRGAFYSINNVSSKVFQKIPITTNVDVSPNFTVSHEIVLDNKLVTALKTLTDNANQLLSMDIKNSLSKPKELLGFVSSVLQQMSSTTFNVSSTFTPFMFDDPTTNKIYDFKLSAIIPQEDQQNFERSGFRVKREGSDVKLFYDNKEFEYPYCLLVLSLSNYLRIEGQPSDFMERGTLTGLTSKQITSMEETLVKSSGRLSSTQSRYENYLLGYLKSYFAIKTGENVQRNPGSSDRDLQMIHAYNALFDLEALNSEAGQMQATGRTLYKYYQRWISPVKEAIALSAKNLDYTLLCNQVLILKNLDCKKITNDHLLTLNQYKAKAAGLSYLKQVKYSFDIDGKLAECEQYLYENTFRSLCNELMDASDRPGQEGAEALKNLKEAKTKYAACKLCQEKSFETEKEYENLSKAKTKEVNLVVVRASKTISDFINESKSWLSANTAVVNDSKDSSGVAKLSFSFNQQDFDKDLAAITAYDKKFEQFKDTRKRQEAEALEKELGLLIDKFKKTYIRDLKSV